MIAAHRQRLVKNQVAFVQDLEVDDTFIAVLMEQDILTEGMVEEITSKPTRQKKASAFMSVINRRGPRAFQALVDALMHSGQDHLALLLDRGMVDQWKQAHPQGRRKPKVTPIPAGYTPIPPPVIPIPPPPTHTQEEEEESFLPVHDMKLVHSADPITAHYIYDREHVYRMSSKPRGRAVILNNEHFIHLGQRFGSQFDAVNITELFKKLGFTTVLWNNLTAQEIKEKIYAEKSLEQHNSADAFVFVALSHGNRGVLYGIDGKREDVKGSVICHNAVSIDRDIITMFDGVNCPALVKKPKMFFIQACQGDLVTRGLQSDDDATDANPIQDLSDKMAGTKLTDEKDAMPSLPSTHEKADILIATSTVTGYKSWRHPELGSWFMRDLIKTCIERAHIEDVLSMTTQINNRISERQVMFKGFLQISETKHTLRKKIFFFPGHYDT